LSTKSADKTEQKPTRTRISGKWRKSRNSQNKEQQTKMHKTRISKRSRQMWKNKIEGQKKTKSKTKPFKEKPGEETHNTVAVQMGNECRRRQPTSRAKQLLAVWNGWDMAPCMRQTAGAAQCMACMACMKTLALDQAPKTTSDRAQGQKGRDMGKSGVASVCHGWPATQACPAPCHPAARPHAAPPPSASSPSRSFQPEANDECAGAQ